MLRSRILATALFCTFLAACSYKPSFINEYKIDVQQGNVLTQEMVSQLKPGQTRDQVRFLLGTPLISDIFHQQRWDYVYRYRDGQTGSVDARKFTVYFDRNERLERVSGDVAAASAADLALPESNSRLIDFGTLSAEDASKPLPAPGDVGFFRRMMDSLGF